MIAMGAVEDKSYLGEFPGMESVWKRYPSGGCRGDYVKVAGIYVYWDEYRGVWGDPEDMSCDNIYCSCPGSLIVKGRVHLTAVPPVAGTQAVSGSLIVPVFDTVSGRWSFVRATSFGGIEIETVTITATIDSASLSQGRIKYGERLSDPSTGVLEVTVPKGSDVTLEFIPVAGYEVSNVNVDSVGQGVISHYTFAGVTEDHTVNVWYRESSELPVYTDFLERSDLKGVYYSSLHSAMSAVKSDYPEGLTQDVEILCVKEGTEYRNATDPGKVISDRIWTAIISGWNKGGRYSLTVNGDGKYTLSAYSLGGVFIRNTDNIIFRNMAFADYANFSKGSTPEEIAAAYSCGSMGDKNKNIAFVNCRFDGRYATSSGTYNAVYGIDTKLTSNVIIDGCTFVHGGARVLKLTGADIIEVSRSSIAGDLSYSIGHSNLIYASDARRCVISDCELNGETFFEYAVQLVNIGEVELRRNHIYKSMGQPFLLSGSGQASVILESNVVETCLTGPKYQYCKFIMRAEQSLEQLTLRNNTVFMNGNGVYFQECFSVAGDVGRLVNYNNIYIDSAGKVNNILSVTGTLTEYLSGNNLYKAVMHSGGTRFNAVRILSNGIVPSGKDNRSLSDMQSLGFERGSVQLAHTEAVLDAENGGQGYGLLSSLASTYPADTLQMPRYDKDYRQNGAGATIGAYNANGTQWDETADTSEGYRGLHVEDDMLFGSDALYTVPSDDTIILSINCADRSRFIITRVYSASKSHTLYGRNIVLMPECRTSGEGVYAADEQYTVETEMI